MRELAKVVGVCVVGAMLLVSLGGWIVNVFPAHGHNIQRLWEPDVSDARLVDPKASREISDLETELIGDLLALEQKSGRLVGHLEELKRIGQARWRTKHGR